MVLSQDVDVDRAESKQIESSDLKTQVANTNLLWQKETKNIMQVNYPKTNIYSARMDDMYNILLLYLANYISGEPNRITTKSIHDNLIYL